MSCISCFDDVFISCISSLSRQTSIAAGFALPWATAIANDDDPPVVSVSLTGVLVKLDGVAVESVFSNGLELEYSTPIVRFTEDPLPALPPRAARP